MILLVHIIVAFGSLVTGSALLVSPNVTLLRATYALTAAALTSGTVMVWQNSAHVLQTCITGLLYLSFVVTMLVLGQRRLAKAQARIHHDQ